MVTPAVHKQELRKRYLEIREAIPRTTRLEKSRRIFQKLFRNPFFRKAEHVALYYSISPEVETRLFLKRILDLKTLYLPKVNRSTRGMSFCRVQLLGKDLCKGAYHIREPKAGCVRRSPSRMDVIIVPGVAFDKKGRRLGRGGGYYDRVLRQAKKVYTIGLCFREQVVSKAPVTAHDMAVDQVITD